MYTYIILTTRATKLIGFGVGGSCSAGRDQPEAHQGRAQDLRRRKEIVIVVVVEAVVV